jgi:type I restriction enzyme S subunit
MAEWRDMTWGELATLEYGKSLREYVQTGGKYRVYGTNGPIGWYDTALYGKPGVIIGRKGAYRGVHYSPHPFFVIDTAFYLKPKVEIDPRWAYYQLLTQDINGMDSGSAIPSTTRPDFYALAVRVPPLPQQKAIAGMLGALDDKIELNRRINETLEAMAQALFQSWFVDFDPARAKLDGRQPTGLDPATAALFPNEFEDSELGPIPKGWEVGK